MKKLFSVICAGLLMVSLVGCSNQIAVQNYDTTKKVIDIPSKNIKVFYPELQGYKGELAIEYMNQNIKQVTDFYVNSQDYTDVQLDYEVKRLDEELVSVLFKGTGKLMGSKVINIQKSINLDVKSTNPIDYANFIKNDGNAQREIKEILDKKAKDNRIKNGFEAEGVFIYFEGDNVVFYYMPLDDSAIEWVELSVPLSEIDGLVNTEFGARPAS